jgi:hypothetical protein
MIAPARSSTRRTCNDCSVRVARNDLRPALRAAGYRLPLRQRTHTSRLPLRL